MQLITILGQTCSGKSQIAVNLAKKYNAAGLRTWVVSCDSRQVYKEFTICSGKVFGEWQNYENTDFKAFYHQGIPHFLIDFVPLNQDYNLARFVKDFCDLLLNSNYIPQPDIVILCGGTGLYARAINQNYDLGLVKPEFLNEYENLKTKLQTLQISALLQIVNQYELLQKNFLALNNSEKNNPPRLVNLILKEQSREQNWMEYIIYPKFESQIVYALEIEKATLIEKVKQRIDERIETGMLTELAELIEKYGGERIASLGLEGRCGYQYHVEGWSLDKFRKKLYFDTLDYASRQLTWLDKEPGLKWITKAEEIFK